LSLAAVLPVAQSSDATATGATVRELERQRAATQAEVRQLASQVGELSALERVSAVATGRLGLTPARPTVVLHVGTPPPERLLPTRFLPRQEVAIQSTTAWWQRLVDVLIVR
jgi:cell division protein FtsL